MPDPNLRGFQEQNNRLKMNRDMCKHALVSKVNSTRTLNVRSNTEQRVRERENTWGHWIILGWLKSIIL